MLTRGGRDAEPCAAISSSARYGDAIGVSIETRELSKYTGAICVGGLSGVAEAPLLLQSTPPSRLGRRSGRGSVQVTKGDEARRYREEGWCYGRCC